MGEIWGWDGKFPALGGWSPRDIMRYSIHQRYLDFLRNTNPWDEHLPEVKDFNSRIRGTR